MVSRRQRKTRATRKNVRKQGGAWPFSSSGMFSKLPSMPTFSRKSEPSNPFLDIQRSRNFKTKPFGHTEYESFGQNVPTKDAPKMSETNRLALFPKSSLSPSALKLSMQDTRNKWTTLTEGKDWKVAVMSTSGKRDKFKDEVDWSGNQIGRVGMGPGSKFFQNVMFDGYPDATKYAYAQDYKFKNASGKVDPKRLMEPSAFITEKREATPVRVYGSSSSEVDLVAREAARRFKKDRVDTYTKEYTNRVATDKKRWQNLVDGVQNTKNTTMKKVRKVYGDYLMSVKNALDKQESLDNEQLEIQAITLINKAIPEFIEGSVDATGKITKDGSVFIPTPLTIKGAKNETNAKAKGEASLGVTIETITNGIVPIVSAIKAPTVPVNSAVVAPKPSGFASGFGSGFAGFFGASKTPEPVGASSAVVAPSPVGAPSPANAQARLNAPLTVVNPLFSLTSSPPSTPPSTQNLIELNALTTPKTPTAGGRRRTNKRKNTRR